MLGRGVAVGLVLIASWWAVRGAVAVWFWVCPLGSECSGERSLNLRVQLGSLYTAFLVVGVLGRLLSPKLVDSMAAQVLGFSVSWPVHGRLLYGGSADYFAVVGAAWRHAIEAASWRELGLAYLACAIFTVFGWSATEWAFRRWDPGRVVGGSPA